MYRDKVDGVDHTEYVTIPWCKCGWRDFAENKTEAWMKIGRHRHKVHGIEVRIAYGAYHKRTERRKLAA